MAEIPIERKKRRSGSPLLLLLIVLLLIAAGWYWWTNYGNGKQAGTKTSSTIQLMQFAHDTAPTGVTLQSARI